MAYLDRIEVIQARLEGKPYLRRFRILMRGDDGIVQALTDMGFTILGSAKQSSGSGGTKPLPSMVARNPLGIEITLRQIEGGWEFGGNGQSGDVERLARRFADLAGAYQVIRLLEKQGWSYRVADTELSVTVACGNQMNTITFAQGDVAVRGDSALQRIHLLAAIIGGKIRGTDFPWEEGERGIYFPCRGRSVRKLDLANALN